MTIPAAPAALKREEGAASPPPPAPQTGCFRSPNRRKRLLSQHLQKECGLSSPILAHPPRFSPRTMRIASLHF